MDSEEDVVDLSLKRKRYLRMLMKERKRKKNEIRSELILRKRWLLQCVEEDKKGKRHGFVD